MNDDVIDEILNDSDAVCPCGADPRFIEGNLSGWHFDIIQTPDENVAEVRCPRCW